MAARALKAECSFIPNVPPATAPLSGTRACCISSSAKSSEQRVLPRLPDLCVSVPVSGSYRGRSGAEIARQRNPERRNLLSERSPRRALPMNPRRVELGVSHWSFIEEQLV